MKIDWRSIESRPGSFSKNAGWASHGDGLRLLFDIVNATFDGDPEFVQRAHAINIIRNNFHTSSELILNFFLFNAIKNGESYIISDQLVQRALYNEHNKDFDLLAISAFNFSRAGVWRGARPFQRYPAPWARNFVVDRLFSGSKWIGGRVNSGEIEEYLKRNMIYGADSPRKYATNLNFLYNRAGLPAISDGTNEVWWHDALYLFLQRANLDGSIARNSETEAILRFLLSEDFFALTGCDPAIGAIAAKNIIDENAEEIWLDEIKATAGFDTKPKLKTYKTKVPKYVKSINNLTPSQTVFRLASIRPRNRKIVRYLKYIYNDACVVCGERLQIGKNEETYSEAAHIKPIGKPILGPDNISNLVILCPNHHKMFDHGAVWFDVKGLEVMVRTVIDSSDYKGRRVTFDPRHPIDVKFIKWHSRFFGHSAATDEL